MSSSPADPTTRSGPAKPSLRQRQRQYTHDSLLEAAVVVFGQKGYGHATIDDIAVEAGVNRGTVYLHFKNKRDVADGLFDALRPSAKASIADLDEVLATGSREAIRDWLHRLLAWYEQHRGSIIALDHVLLEGGFQSAGLDSVYIEAMPRLLDRWPAERRDELRMRLWLLAHMMSRFFVVGRVDGLLPEVEETLVIDLMAELWTAGLGVEAATIPPPPPRRAPRQAP